MDNNKTVLCGSSSYEQKFYINEEFQALPKSIKEELQIMCVLFTEDVGGILALEFEDDGTLEFVVTADEGDLLFDEIGSVLKVKQLREEKKELLESVELFYKVYFLNEDVGDLLN